MDGRDKRRVNMVSMGKRLTRMESGVVLVAELSMTMVCRGMGCACSVSVWSWHKGAWPWLALPVDARKDLVDVVEKKGGCGYPLVDVSEVLIAVRLFSGVVNKLVTCRWATLNSKRGGRGRGTKFPLEIISCLGLAARWSRLCRLCNPHPLGRRADRPEERSGDGTTAPRKLRSNRVCPSSPPCPRASPPSLTSYPTPKMPRCHRFQSSLTPATSSV
jgi:hypothetical protein